MEFENVEMIENVDEAMDVVKEVIPEKGFKLGKTGKGVLIGTLVTALAVITVTVLNKVHANKAKQEESEGEESEDMHNVDVVYSDVDGE